MGRRMVDTAARLTDEVLPHVPVRQWVLSLPFEIRYRLAWDGDLTARCWPCSCASFTAGIDGRHEPRDTPAHAVVR